MKKYVIKVKDFDKTTNRVIKKALTDTNQMFKVNPEHPYCNLWFLTGNGFTCTKCGINYNWYFNYCPDCGHQHGDKIPKNGIWVDRPKDKKDEVNLDDEANKLY